ncbi:MAG: MFS transporter [Dehalococcoidia bacterium]|nr:MFS transporter [Dehalococcoidia bacterium]
MDLRKLTVLLLSTFVALLGVGIIVPILPIYATDLGASGTVIGLMVAGFSFSRGILQPLVGGISDRRGKKRFMVAGLVIYSLSGLAYTIAGSPTDLVIIRIIHGVGSAMIVPMAMSYIGELAPEGEEGKYMGYFNIALFTGIGAGPLIGGIFLDSFGVNSAFYAMSSLSALSMVLVLTLVPKDVRTGFEEAAPSLLTTFRRMTGNLRVLGILVGRMSTMFVMVPTMAFLPLLMDRFMEASGLQVGMVIATRTLTNASLQTPFGKMADRVNKTPFFLLGVGIMAVAMLAVPTAGNIVMLLGIFATLGVGEAIVWPTLGALATEEGRTYGQGSMMGVFNMAMSIGIFCGSLAAGALVDTIGLSWMFISVGCVLVACGLLAVFLMKARDTLPAASAGPPRPQRRTGVAGDW